ncbi:MAG TPA: YbaB/EbfC family nucleoid-associated protein [Chromatiales bacterium]|nr:YbaB/EbfC family nucleoid-associated protein [Chromatiales bacterium]
MKADLGQLMKQAQKMQAQMQKAQEELASLEVEGQAGGGLVKLTMTGRHEVRSVQIDDSLLGEDRDMLEDILVAAFNDALRKVEATVQEKYSGLAGGMGLPGGLGGLSLPFG